MERVIPKQPDKPLTIMLSVINNLLGPKTDPRVYRTAARDRKIEIHHSIARIIPGFTVLINLSMIL